MKCKINRNALSKILQVYTQSEHLFLMITLLLCPQNYFCHILHTFSSWPFGYTASFELYHHKFQNKNNWMIIIKQSHFHCSRHPIIAKSIHISPSVFHRPTLFPSTSVCAPLGIPALPCCCCRQHLPWLQEGFRFLIPTASTAASTAGCEEHSPAQPQSIC